MALDANISRLTLARYLMLPEKEQRRIWEFLFDIIEGKPFLRVGRRRFFAVSRDFLYLRWETLEKVKVLLEGGEMAKLATTLTRIDRRTLARVKVGDFIAFVRWVVDELERVAEVERKAIRASGAAELPDYLKRHGYLIALNRLAGDDITKHERIMKLPYVEVIRQLAYLADKEHWEQQQIKKNMR